MYEETSEELPKNKIFQKNAVFDQTWENYGPWVESSSFHLLIHPTKQLILIITLIDNTVFNWNRIYLKNPLCVLIWHVCQNLEKNWLKR